ncbi:glycosyl hydrolase [Flammeovirgaceae bacterium SG7u.111]|nr:glycosyl hydrolase [Flammeovirgaceae bacterium SG7u.132]WPO37606.1 glycosyl hydrolase [Flammeovirgaceae bacterium SG7u.111]
MKKKTIHLQWIMIWFLLASCNPQAPEQPTVTDWPEITNEMKPWARWWWMGSAVDSVNTSQLLESYAKVGIGGVEIAPIYGAVGFEEKYIDFLSPEWMAQLEFSVRKAKELDMGVDMTVGTGWPFGGPQISPQEAASKLIVQQYQLSAGQKLSEKITVDEPKQKELGVGLLALMAYSETGETVNITDKTQADGTLIWSPESGKWTLYAAFLGKTRQKVKRAAPGGEGYTMDHMSAEALNTYLARFNKAFDHKPTGVRSFFNDSYEVYGADFSPRFFEEFQTRRGYDLRQFLPLLISTEKNDTIARIKSDYRETMSDMLLENFSEPWAKWIHEQGAIARNQAHGSPGNLLDLYAAVDIPETETFGSAFFPIPNLPNYTVDRRNIEPDMFMMKFASSAANVTGKPLVASETYTWQGEHFKVPLSQCKPAVEQLFLGGVNHVFYHGTTYSPKEAAWPGWLFYASVNMAPSNSFWDHSQGLHEYIARCQSFLQSSKPDNELLVYWPVYDVWQHSEKLLEQLSIHHIDEWMHPTQFYKMSEDLYSKGYSMDFISDQLLKNATVKNGEIATAEGQHYKTLILPACELMPLVTLKQALALAENGATVIFQELPKDVPGFNQLAERRAELKSILDKLAFTTETEGIRKMPMGKGQVLLSVKMQQTLEDLNIEREALTDIGLQFIRKSYEGDKLYYVVNHTASSIDAWIPLNAQSKDVVIFDPQTSEIGLSSTSIKEGKTLTHVQMEPGASLILQAVNQKVKEVKNWAYEDNTEKALTLSNEWKVEFTEGGPTLPEPKTLTELSSWTDLGDEIASSFSGKAVYTTTFELADKNQDEYMLNLGDVRESARVWVNDKEVGILWHVPFEAKIGTYLKQGSNTLKIEVANLMANRIIDLDKKGIEWRKYHEINFVDLNYKPFNASDWEWQPSGLLGPVTITPVRTSSNQGN